MASPNTRKGGDSKFLKNKRDSYHQIHEPLYTDGDQDGPGEPTPNDYYQQYSSISQSKGKQKQLNPNEFYSRDQRRKAQSVLKTLQNREYNNDTYVMQK